MVREKADTDVTGRNVDVTRTTVATNKTRMQPVTICRLNTTRNEEEETTTLFE